MTRQIFRVTKDATWLLARILEDAEEFNSDRDSFRGRKNSSPDFGRMKNPENNSRTTSRHQGKARAALAAIAAHTWGPAAARPAAPAAPADRPGATAPRLSA
jgi:hypothetical protein